MGRLRVVRRTTDLRAGCLVLALAVQGCIIPFPDRAHEAGILKLQSGDSVLVTRPTAISLARAPKILMASFGPFVRLSDTTRVRRLAIELHAALLPQLDSAHADLFMLQATPTSPRDFPELLSLTRHRFTFRKVAGERWCLVNEHHEIAAPPQTAGCLASE